MYMVQMRLNILLGIFVGICIVCVQCISDSSNEENLNAEANNKPLVKSACERSKLQVVCPKGKVINIIRANYGRFKDLAKCNPKNNKKFDTKCKSSKSLTVMLQRCHLKQDCSVDATNSLFGDPCPKTIKYLEIRYRCVVGKETTTKLTTERPKPKITTKTLATFTTGKPTPEVGTETTTKLTTEKLTSKVITETTEKLTTEKLTSKVSTFEDTTVREVTTVGNKPRSKHACEHDTLHIECEVGKVIRVLEANYGRTSTVVCSQNIAQHWNINCVHNKTRGIMRKMCDGKKNCNVAAENCVFTDTCKNTLKYLEVNYLCEDDVTTTSETPKDKPTTSTTLPPVATSTREHPETSSKTRVTSPETSSKARVTSPETSSKPRVTFLETSSKPRVTSPETSSKPRVTSPETSSKPRVTSPETSFKTRVTSPETSSKTRVTSPETSSKPRVTSPETSCSEEDLDCIIDDLGKRPDWFVCEKDMASYPHPASKKLFIFCMNWKPFVKKCGQGRVFSEKLMTCN